jgi:O2-independent ubiquinone biosynthesis protein UbiV
MAIKMNSNNQNKIPKLSLGPVSYYWDRDTTFEFYKTIEKSKIDIVYLGETICTKRKLLRRDDWIGIAKRLQDSGKEVILSSMTLIESNSDIATLKTLCQNNQFTIEANDISAVQLLSGHSFITGPAINIYNPRTLQMLYRKGLKRWVLPVELSKYTLEEIQKEKPDNVETEVLVYGRLPLAYSARCFTARAHNLPKDDCQYRCLDYPDGLLLSTQEKEKFLTLNGIQTQSAKTSNLIIELDELIDLNVDVLRINPPSKHCEKIIELFYQCLHQSCSTEKANSELQTLMPAGGSCNGYWHGVSGMDYQASNKESLCQNQTL